MRNPASPPSPRLRSAWSALLILVAAAPAFAVPPAPATTNARRASPMAPPARDDLLEALAHLPDDVPVTVLVPSPERLIRRLEGLLDRLSPGASPLERRVFLEGLREILGGPISPATFRSLGIGVDRELALLFDPTSEVAIVRFALHDRRRFEAWLARTVPEERRSLDLGRERAIVLYPDSDLPIICLLRFSHAHCQIGSGPEARPGAALLRLASEKIRPISDSADLEALRSHLPEDADLIAFLRPKLLSPRLNAWMTERARRAHRFASAQEERSALARSEQRMRTLRTLLDEGRLVSLSFTAEPASIDARLHAVLEPRAVQTLAGLIPSELPDRDIVSWSHTPALARLLVSLQPEHASILFERLGLRLPAEAVDGSFSALLLGVDTECRAAKSLAKDPRARLFFLPLAAAIGLRGPLDVREMIREPPSGEGLEMFAGVKLEEGPDPRSFRAEHLGNPLEVRLLDRVVLMGTGHGAAAAAERRWSAQVEPRPKRDAFLEVSVDLAAVRAALSAARIEHSNEELKRLQLMEQKLELWLSDLRRIELSAGFSPVAPQLSVALSGR